jgi:hypothetical protein
VAALSRGADAPVPAGADDAEQRARMQYMADEYDQWCSFLGAVRPVATNFRVRVMQAKVGGQVVPQVELTAITAYGPVVMFIPPANAKALAARIEEAATGAITHTDPFRKRIEVPR